MSALTTAAARTARPAPAEDRRERPALRVVPEHRRVWPVVLAIVAVSVAGVFGVISLSALAAESAFAARELESDIEALSVRYDELTAEVASLESPGRVRAVATEELGMVPSETPAFLLVKRPLRPAVVEDEVPADGVTDPVKQALGTGG